MEQLIHFILTWLEELGAWGVLIGLMIEIIPSELVLSYAGYLVHRGTLTFTEAVLFGTVGATVAQLFLYWIGKYGGRPFLEKYGKYLFIKQKHIDLTENWFRRYGAGVIFTARFIPVMRQAISIPAGIAKMPLWLYILYTALASVLWAVLFIYLGKTLGENWEQIHEYAAPYLEPVIWAAVGLSAVYFGYKIYRFRSKKSRDHGDHGDYGYAGEQDTAHQLRFIGGEYRVLNHRRVSTRTGVQEIDHVVIGPNGVFHIDSKNWSGEIRFTEHGVERSKDGQHNVDPTAQLYRHEYVLKELLRANHLKADVVGIICFTHKDCTIIGKSPAFATLKLDRLLHFIKNYRPKTLLNPQEVKLIAELIEKHSTPSR